MPGSLRSFVDLGLDLQIQLGELTPIVLLEPGKVLPKSFRSFFHLSMDKIILCTLKSHSTGSKCVGISKSTSWPLPNMHQPPPGISKTGRLPGKHSVFLAAMTDTNLEFWHGWGSPRIKLYLGQHSRPGASAQFSLKGQIAGSPIPKYCAVLQQFSKPRRFMSITFGSGFGSACEFLMIASSEQRSGD